MRPAAAAPLILILALVSSSEASLHGINFFCGRTSFPDLCARSIIEAGRQIEALNKSTVLAILMRAVGAKAREDKAFTLKLAKQSRFDSKTLGLLRDCANNYDTALDNLSEASKAIKSRDDGTRDAMLSSMISNLSTCDDGFNDFSIKSPIADRTELLRSMVDNCLAVAK